MAKKSNGASQIDISPDQFTVTPTQAITIAGTRFTVPVRYAEGHVLTAGEANALNQTYLENCRNNLSGRAKDGTLTQEIVDQYAASYVFGQRTGGVASADPVESMALTIARKRVKSGGMSAAQITKAARELLASDRGASIRKAARAMVEA
jgi:hypothetical protein